MSDELLLAMNSEITGAPASKHRGSSASTLGDQRRVRRSARRRIIVNLLEYGSQAISNNRVAATSDVNHCGAAKERTRS
jgi:hypothetical protein